MKMKFRIIALISAILIMLPLFISCDKDGGDKETTDGAETTPPLAEVAVDITLEMLKSYKIIVPEALNTEMYQTYSDLIMNIEKYTGVKLTVGDDFVKEGSDIFKINEYEILLGATNREESVTFHKTLKSRDYGYGIVGKKIIIAGHTPAEVAESASSFIKDVLMEYKSDNKYVMEKDAGMTITMDYKYNSLIIDGVDIYKYSIVYAYPSYKGEKEIAESLREWVTDNYGYVLNCYPDTKEYNGDYEIQIGETKRVTDEMKAKITDRNKANIQTSDKFIWLAGSEPIVLDVAMSKLIELIKADIKENTVISLVGNKEYNIKSFDLNVMNYNIRYAFEENLRNPDDVIVSIRNQNPDIFGVNEDTTAWLKKLNNAFSSEYTRITGKQTDTTSSPHYNCIYYRTTDYELLESGTKWLSSTPDVRSKFEQSKHYRTFTYAIFKDLASGIRFMYVNVHLDYNSDTEIGSKARALQVAVLLSFINDYTDIPIVVGGDFNSSSTGSGPKEMIDKTAFSNASDIAKLCIQTSGTLVNDYTTRSKWVFDYIFVTTRNVTVNKFEAVDNKMNGKYPSDHLPVQAELTIWQRE